MPDEELRERLRRQTGEAGRRHAAVDAQVDRRLDRPPGPGDLFVLSETAEHPVEWAVLDRHPTDPQRLLAVPADTNSLIGSADVAVSEEAPRGPLSLRCAYPVWLDAGACNRELRTGFLEPATLERARRKRESVARGTAGGTVLEREVDGEADYHAWLEVLEQARAAAPARAAGPEQDSSESRSQNVVPLRRRAAWVMSGPLAVAASVLLMVTVGVAAFVGGVRWSSSQEPAEISSVVTNLPLIVLALGQLRGDGDAVEVAPDASHLMLILQVDETAGYSSYRLELRERSTGRQVWSDSSLEASRLSELTVLLPRSLMPDGEYELRLHGLRGGQPEEPLMERILTIESPASG